MDGIEIWPNGEVDFGAGADGGDRIVMIQFTDQETGRKVRLGFQRHAFVTFADHLAMVSESVMDGDFFEH